MAETTVFARISSPLSSTAPTARPFSTMILATGVFGADGHASLFRGQFDCLDHGAHAAYGQASARRACRQFRPPADSRVQAARSASAARDGCQAWHRKRARPFSRSSSRCSSSTSATFISSMRRKSRMSSLPSCSAQMPVMAKRRRIRKGHAAQIGRSAREQGLQDAGIAQSCARSSFHASCPVEAPARLSP